MTNQALLTFVQISDTHITPGDNTDFRPHHYSAQLIARLKEMSGNGSNMGHIHDVPASIASRTLVDEINNLPFSVDFVLNTGDVMTDPDSVEEYQAVTDIYQHLKYPIYYMAGNHDLVPALRTLMPNVTINQPTLDYVIEQNGARVICLDSSTHGVDHGGGLSDKQLAWFREQLAKAPQMPTVVAVHHPPLSMANEMLDVFGFHRGEELHAAIRESGSRVDAVLSGHIHQAVDTIQDGVFYTCVQSPFGQTPFYPALSPQAHESKPNPGFNIVIITAERTFIRRYSYANPVTEKYLDDAEP